MTESLQTTPVREVVGVADSREALDSAVEKLLLAGVDRSRISLMASREAILDKLHQYYVDPTPLADALELPRREVVTREDTTALTPLLFGTLLAVATLGATALVASGGVLAAALATTVGGGALATTLARLLKRRVLGDADPEALERDLAAGGLVIFVRVWDSAEEAKVEAILREHARNVHIHEVDVAKILLDTPLGEIRPDVG